MSQATAIDTSKDWPDDFGHENGRYQCRCCECGSMFYGHKRRVVCKGCTLSCSWPLCDCTASNCCSGMEHLT